MTEKLCGACGASKPVTDFFRCSSRKDGLQNRCKPCQIERRRAHRSTVEGAAMAAETARKWYAANKSRANELSRAWAMKNPDKAAKWRLENPEAAKAMCQKYKKKARAEISTVYVRQLIAKRAGCSASQVPRELAEAKRAVIAVQRLLKEKKT